MNNAKELQELMSNNSFNSEELKRLFEENDIEGIKSIMPFISMNIISLIQVFDRLNAELMPENVLIKYRL
jgi:hypothetical protein